MSKREMNFKSNSKQLILGCLVAMLSLAFVFTVTPAMAQNNDCVAGNSPGNCINTTRQPPELPVEVETELAPAGSLKQAPLLKEWIQLLENPYAPVVRRPGFGVTMPELNVWPLNRTVLTNETLRLRTSDGEISWDQPGPVFDPDQVCDPITFPCDANNVPLQLRIVIGELVVDADNNLVVRNPETNASLDPDLDVPDPRIPPDGTIVAVPAVINGILNEFDPLTGERTPVTSLETPINENDLLRASTDVAGVPAPLRPYIGRLGAETLGKALFWDMQVGSDGVQACGTCHFAAGADSRTKNQLSPGFLGGNFTLEVKGPNEDVNATDFPFRRLADPELASEGDPNQTVLNDSNDVMSSMGVSRFKLFVDIPPIGTQSFGPAVNGVAPLLPDIGNDTVAEPIAAFTIIDPVTGNVTKLRRVEPRNTPTFHSAAFNFENFWDGRARFEFNGGSVFGASDPTAHIFIDPGNPGPQGGPLQGATNGIIRPAMDPLDPRFNQPVRIGFSSLASQATGPPLSEFEMSFAGRNWQKIGKKLLQGDVVNTAPQSAGSPNSVMPLANQLVAIDDSRLGPFSNQGGSVCSALGRATVPGKPGLCISYGDMIRLAFMRQLWQNNGQHLNGAPGADPFDGYVLSLAGGSAAPANTNQFRQIEANMPLFFGLAVQTYEQLTIPDDSPFDRFMDANPRAAFGVGQPGEQAVLPPDQVPGLVGPLTFPDPDKFGPDELFGFDIFSGASLTAALPPGSPRNPILTNNTGAQVAVGSNPFMRTGRCMICHLGPEQTDATISIAHGTLHSDTEFEFPTPPNAPEPTGPFRFVAGFLLEDEVGETAQDAIEVEPRDMAMLDDPATPYDDRIISAQSHFGFGDQGIYNIGVRPTNEDAGRGGNDPFVQPLSRAALAMKNLAGPAFEPPDDSSDPANVMAAFDPALGPGGGLFEETGEGLTFPGTTYTLQSINPGLSMDPITPLMPAYMAPWLNNLPAGELHPQIDELGFAPNTISLPNGGPALEFTENLFGSDVHCGVFDPAFGLGSPNFGWGPRCPNSQTGVTNNFDPPLQGTWPFANRVTRMGAFKAAQLRNVELTGPYFHTGSMLTLRQVVDFYMRGGDFPVTNNGSRDAHIVNITAQAFGFGRTTGADLAPFADALPDTAFQYGVMPYTGAQGAATPEYATPEDAKVALVKFLISLTDERVKFERAPFDRPEIFVPVDGTAPENTLGRLGLAANSTGLNATFRQVNATGAGGRPDPLPNFLGINSTEGPGPDHFDR